MMPLPTLVHLTSGQDTQVHILTHNVYIDTCQVTLTLVTEYLGCYILQSSTVSSSEPSEYMCVCVCVCVCVCDVMKAVRLPNICTQTS